MRRPTISQYLGLTLACTAILATSGCSNSTANGDTNSDENSNSTASNSADSASDASSDASGSDEASRSNRASDGSNSASGEQSSGEDSQSVEDSTATSADSSSSAEDSSTSASDDSSTAETSSDSSDTTSTTDAGDPVVLYKDNCAECHGEIGEGVADKGYELQHPTREYFDWVTRNGRDGDGFLDPMPSYDETIITPEQLEAIWDYLDTPAKPTTGEGLYADYCASCHGDDGRGGVVGIGANHSEPGFTFHVQEGFPNVPFGDRAGYMPGYDASWLSTAELALMKEYLDSIGAW